jgi:hypothetical protein
VYFWAGTNPGGDAHSLYLYAHSESDPSNVYVIFVASATDSFHIPEPGDVVNEYQAALDIVYTVATDSVGYATQATYCNLSEFNLLKERTVTTHKEGEPTTGESQDIYGIKTFKNKTNFYDLTLYGNITCDPNTYCEAFINKITVLDDLRVQNNEYINGSLYVLTNTEIDGNLTLSGSLNALTSTASFSAVYADHIRSTEDYEISVERSGQSVNATIILTNIVDPENAAALIQDCKVAAYSVSAESGGYSIKDYGANTFSSVIAQNTSDPSNAAAIVQNCRVSAYSVDAINDISCPTGTVSGQSVSVGAGGLTGLHPTVSSGTVNVPIGGIVAVYASAFVIGQGSGLNMILIGDEITVGVSDSIYAAKWNSDSGEWEQGKQLPSSASYVALSDVSSLSGINYNGMLLVVRKS